jgi:hypothetical protein
VTAKKIRLRRDVGGAKMPFRTPWPPPEESTVRAVCFLSVLWTAAVEKEVNPIVAPESKLEKLWSEGEFTEGPAWGPDRCVYFSDIGNRILTAHED